MAKKQRNINMPQDPWFATAARNRWSDGRVLGTDGSMWLYRAIPLGNVADARTPALSGVPAEPLMLAFGELAAASGAIRVKRRKYARSAYREVHILLVDVPTPFRPTKDDQLAQMHLAQWGKTVVRQRCALFGVRLNKQAPDPTIAGRLGWIADTFIYGGYPLQDYAADAEVMSAALNRCGLRIPSRDEFDLAHSWWNHGLRPNIPYQVHVDHMHMFDHLAAAQSAARLAEVPCERWPETSDSFTLTFASASEPELPYVSVLDPMSHWVSRLVNQGAVALSIRAKVEPEQVTREEIRRLIKQYDADLGERYNSGALERTEQNETYYMLKDADAQYASRGTPTLSDASVVVAFTGRGEHGYDVTDLGDHIRVSLSPMVDLQEQAFAETMLASNVRVNPILNDLPSQAVAFSGLPNLSAVGEGKGALLGFTEHDRQPAYVNAMASVDQDSLPIWLGVGQTGAGKSTMMNLFGDQWCRELNSRGERRPVLIWDPKQGSDFSAVAHRTGGTVYSLDSLLTSDGVLDGIRVARTPESGILLAHSMLMGVNPYGSLEARANMEGPLMSALRYGVMEGGARCILQALELAVVANVVPDDVVAPIRNYGHSNPLFNALCGRDPQAPALSVSEGLTYIKVGDVVLDLPEPGQTDLKMTQRVSLELVRAVAYGAMMAMAGREGCLLLDEAWVFTSAGRSEMEKIGRMSRSMQVLPMLFTQRCTDALDAGLAGYIGRGAIMPITDEAEAIAACKLFRIEPTPQLLARITAPPTLGDSGTDSGAPNFASMRALVDPATRQVLRGTIVMLVDVNRRAVPVEVCVPADLLREISTNRLDQLRRGTPTVAAHSAPVPDVAPLEVFDWS